MTVMQAHERRTPPGWCWATLDEVARINERDTAIRELPDELVVTFVPMSAVDGESGSIALPEERTLGAVRKGYTPFAEDDVIFAKITPCMENGKAAIARGLRNGRGFGSTEFHVLRPEPGVSSEWLYYFVRQASFREDAKASFTGTAGQLRVPTRFLEGYSIPVPPLPEQHRIVAALEQHFSRLDAAVAALRAAQAKLRRYRAAVLQAACTGRLVPQDPEDEPANHFVARIATEEEHVPQGRRHGSAHPGTTAQLADSVTLPSGWCWTSVEQVAEVRLGRQRSPSRASGPNMRSYLRAANVTWHGLDLTDVKQMDFSPDEQTTYRLQPGDILLGEASGSPSEVGKPAVWKGELGECYFQNTLIRVRSRGVLPEYFYVHFLYDAMTQRFSRVARGVGIHHLGAEGLARWRIALPPLTEQHRIVAEVERRLSLIRVLAADVATAVTRADRLRQALLQRAFAGRLVPQDPDDEPADQLLERIRAQRLLQQPPRAARRPRQRAGR